MVQGVIGFGTRSDKVLCQVLQGVSKSGMVQRVKGYGTRCDLVWYKE